MSILSVRFIAISIFAVVVIFCYGLIEKNIKENFRIYIRNTILTVISVLLIASLGKYELIFYFCYVIIVYLGGRLAECNKCGLVVAVILGVLPLIVFKYMGLFGAQSTFFPIGISYVTFKSIGYVCDIYNKRCKCERNFLILMSYILFFPELFVGPIDRTDGLLLQMKDEKHGIIKYDSWVESINYILWGLFLKLVVADRMGIYVNAIYNQIYKREGFEVLVATLLFSAQIYYDFAGCTYIVIGIGKLLGFDLIRNFKRPYLATSVVDFWRRWHISLTNWLRDYIYIPLGGNRKGSIRKNINILIVFTISGIWHGSGLNYLVWGLLNGIYQIVGMLTLNTRDRICLKIGFDPTAGIIKVLRIIGVYIWMTSAWIFFRAKDLTQACLVYKKIFSVWNLGVLADGSLYQLGLNQRNWMVMLLCIVGVCIVEWLSERGINWQKYYKDSHCIVKGFIWYVLIIMIIIFGIYGSEYDATQFIYENF